MNSTVRCIWHEACTLGESPIWHPLEKALYWVDIVQCKLHRLDVKKNDHQYWTMPTEICCIAPNRNGGLIAALREGITILNPVSNKIHYIEKLPEKLSKITMFNDGHCDRQGRFWVGCKDIFETKSHADIFRLSAQKKLISQASHFIVSNGLVASLDSKYFYIADSPKKIIYRYDFDITVGAISNPIVFATLSQDAGSPDGMTIDSEGYLWNCHFRGWHVTRYSPDGKIDKEIQIPTESPTSCCLGGKDLKTLYVTSAARDVKESEFKNQPHAGCVFAIELDVAGVEEPCFKG